MKYIFIKTINMIKFDDEADQDREDSDEDANKL